MEAASYLSDGLVYAHQSVACQIAHIIHYLRNCLFTYLMLPLQQLEALA